MLFNSLEFLLFFPIVVTFYFLLPYRFRGANWTFIIWGALHGFYLIFAIWTKNLGSKTNEVLGLNTHIKLNRFLSVIITFILVVFAWIFFRANSVTDAFVIIQHMFQFSTSGVNLFYFPVDFKIALISIFLLIVIEYGLEHSKSMEVIHNLIRPYKWALLI